MIVSVIGAGGHVGLPFSLVVANAGHKVHGIDRLEELCEVLNCGTVPYVEHGATELLKTQLQKGNIEFTTNSSYIKESDVVAIMLGTPVDAENNPRLDDLFNFVDYALIPFMRKGTLVILRSTVSPGTTEVIRDRITNACGWEEGKDYFLVFCPERVLQTKGIEETSKLPQLIGAFSEKSFNKASAFFKTFVNNTCLSLTPREAEFGKLITNMYRYVTFAFANEMWMLGEKQGVNIHNVIKAANYEYERMAVPLPGPNVGGPCLFKDGRFLLQDVPYVDLIQTSFIINEGMPDYIFNKIKGINPDISNVLILGSTFKANCDDTRNSLSFKMVKVCKKHGVTGHLFDPYTHTDLPLRLDEYDAVIMMTPHDEFKVMDMHLLKKECVIADVWKFLPESKSTVSGIYEVGDFYE